MKQNFASFARYNRWANRLVYETAAKVTDADYRADRGAFFGSLHGTLNHLLVADLIWMKRFTGQGEAPGRLDAILHHDFVSLRQAREAQDERIITHIDDLREAALAADLSFRRVNGDPVTMPLWQALAHFFNHQTHHRGQAHTLLTQMGQAVPQLDLLYYFQES